MITQNKKAVALSEKERKAHYSFLLYILKRLNNSV